MNPSQLLEPETKELLQSLPIQLAWGLDLYLHKGFWIYSTDLNPLLSSQNNFQATDADVFLVTPPKSGTTWLKSLAFAITKRSLYAPTDPNHPLLSANPHELVPFFEVLYAKDNNPNLSHIPSPRLFSTHYPYKLLSESVNTTKCRIIYLCRDPKDMFISMWHHTNKVIVQSSDVTPNYSIPLEEAFELFRKGITPTGPVWDHVLEYWNMSLKDPEKVLFLKYEDLKGDIISEVKKMAEFIGFPFSAEEESKGVIEEIARLCSFNNLSNLQVNITGYSTEENKDDGSVFILNNKDFFRKGEVGDWKNYMTSSMREELDQVTEQKLLGSGLKFD